MDAIDALIQKYGGNPLLNPAISQKYVVQWAVPADIRQGIPALPAVIPVNTDVREHLERTFRDLIKKGYAKEIKSFDGTFNIRAQTGTVDKPSTHAFAYSIDLNAQQNPWGGQVTWSPGFLQVWRDNGWVLGAEFKPPRVDGMHFEWTKYINSPFIKAVDDVKAIMKEHKWILPLSIAAITGGIIWIVLANKEK